MEWVVNMHEYSIDLKRHKILFILAAISILITSIINATINYLTLNIPFIEFTISIGAIGVYGILYYLFDNYFWKWKWLQKYKIIKTPNLNGTWNGEFSSSYHEFRKAFGAELIIKQTWTKIYIKGTFKDSTSSSSTASLKVNDGVGIKLLYSYINDKNPENYEKSMSNHRGYGNLEIIDNSMSGNYFNDPTNNANHGKLTLTLSDS